MPLRRGVPECEASVLTHDLDVGHVERGANALVAKSALIQSRQEYDAHGPSNVTFGLLFRLIIERRIVRLGAAPKHPAIVRFARFASTSGLSAFHPV